MRIVVVVVVDLQGHWRARQHGGWNGDNRHGCSKIGLNLCPNLGLDRRSESYISIQTD